MERATSNLLGALALATLCLPACSPAPLEVTRPSAARDLASPTVDTTPHCSDLSGGLRACWDEAGQPVSLSKAPFPEPSPSGRGFLCEGSGEGRRCVDRGTLAPPFRCDGPRCSQRQPRLPDDGEWECADMAGAVVCRGGDPAAGAAPGGRGRGYTCGLRSREGQPPERLCVDLSPDLPDGAAPGLRCHFEASAGLHRVCELGALRPALGTACGRESPCVDGSVCVTEGGSGNGGRCVPRRPRPSCWLASDCAAGACRFGTCTPETPP